MTLVRTPEDVLTVAYGQTTVVEVSTTVVTPPTVCVPGGTEVEAAAQTVVDSVRVIVVAGTVYTPGVGQVVANGVGTAAAELVGGGTGAELAEVGGKYTRQSDQYGLVYNTT